MAKELRQAHAQEWVEAESECRQLQKILRRKSVREAKIQGCLNIDLNTETVFSIDA